MDSILSEDWSYYQKNFPTSLEGRDKEGKPSKHSSTKIKNMGHFEKSLPDTRDS